MLTRIDTFGGKHQARFPAGTLGAQLFAHVSAGVREINEQEVARRLASGSSRESRAHARQLLRQQLVRIRDTARAMAVEAPALVAFDLPAQQGDRALLDLARTFARDAAPLSARFIEHRLPETFLTDLEARIDAFAAVVQRRIAGRSSRNEATARLNQAVATAMAAARRLDAIVANEFRDEPQIVAAWKLDRVIGPSRRQPRATAAVPSPLNPAAGGSDSPPSSPAGATVAPAVAGTKDADKAA